MDDLSERQKIALLEGGFWINMPAAVLHGQIVKTIIMPSHDKLLAVKDFLSDQPFDEKARNYQITWIPLYDDNEEMHDIVFKHVGPDANAWEDFLSEIGENNFSAGLKTYRNMSAEQKRAALIKYLNL